MNPKELIAELMARGWTQVQIAAAVGIGQAQVSRLFIGERHQMHSGNWERLKALHSGGEAPPVATPTEKAA